MPDPIHETSLSSRVKFDSDIHAKEVEQLRHEEMIGALKKIAEELFYLNQNGQPR